MTDNDVDAVIDRANALCKLTIEINPEDFIKKMGFERAFNLHSTSNGSL